MSSNKPLALAEIKTIVDNHNLSKNDVLSLFNDEATSVAIKVTTFIAGIFFVVGLVSAASHYWDDMSKVQQLIFTLSVSITTFVSAMYFARGRRIDNMPLVISLLIIPIFLEPLGASVAVTHFFGDEYVNNNVKMLMQLVLAIMAFQYLVVGYFYRHVQILFPLGLLFAAALLNVIIGNYTLHDIFSSNAFITLVVGFLLLCTGILIERVRGYNPWMAITYFPALLGIVFSSISLTDTSMVSASFISLFISSIAFTFGLKMKRKALIWPAGTVMVVSFTILFFEIVDVGVSSALLLATLGLVTLYVIKLKNKNNKLE